MLLKELDKICKADGIVVSHDADRRVWEIIRLFRDGTNQKFTISEEEMDRCKVDLMEYYVS